MNKEQDRIDRLIQAVLTVDPARGLENRIRQRVQSEAQARRMVIRRLEWGAGLACAVALVVLMIGFPERESNHVDRATAPQHDRGPAEVSVSVNNEPSISQPSPVLSPATADSAARSMSPLVIAVEGPLVQAASSAFPAEAISLLPFKDFSLGIATPTLITAALPDPEVPQFEIRAFSLSASNEGVAE